MKNKIIFSIHSRNKNFAVRIENKYIDAVNLIWILNVPRLSTEN